jgi:ankyrin repeat protein
LPDEKQYVDNVQCLVEAASAGNLEIIGWLRSLNQPFNTYVTYGDSSNGSTPVKAALDGKHYEVASFLIEHGAPTFFVTAEFSYSALDEAANKNDLEDVEFLLKNGADPNLYIRGETPLVTAIKSGNNALSKYLIKNGAFISYNQDFLSDPLDTARQTGNTEMESYLLKMGAVDKRVVREREKILAEREKMLAEAQRRQALNSTLDVISNIAIIALGVAVGVSASNYTRPAQTTSSANNREIQRQQNAILRLQKQQLQQLNRPITCKSDVSYSGTVDTKCQRGY